MQDILNREKNPYRVALGRMRRTFLQVGLISAAINLLMLTGPIYMLQVYDRVLSSGSIATLQGLFIIVVVLYAFLGIYEFLRARLLSRASYRLDQQVGDKAFGFWIRSSQGREQGDRNPVRDLEVVRGFVSSPAVLGLFDLPWIPLFMAIVFFIHPWLGYLAIGGAVIVAGAALLNRMLTGGTIAEAVQFDAAERNFTERSRRNTETLAALGMQRKVVRRWQDIHENHLSRVQAGGDRSEGIAAFSKSFRLLLQSSLLTLGAYLAIQQEITPGSIIAASIIAGRALAPLDQVIGQWRAIGRASEAHKGLKSTLDAVGEERRHVRLPDPKGNIEARRVIKFSPATRTGDDVVKILDRVSFDLEPGDGLGVIGNSAAGKSSLARVLVGAWRPDLGEVRLDGATLDQWDPEELGRHIGYLPQSVEMLPGTIAENIARFDPAAPDSDVIEAAQIAGVHEMILTMPEGYSTQIGRTEQPLSGGQVQRLGLARAIFGIPRLIVLDEPNSNLDSVGDDALTAAINTLRARGSVVIVMTHRPSAIAAVNKVLILHKGAVAQFGPKEKVLRQSVRPATAPHPLLPKDKVTG